MEKDGPHILRGASEISAFAPYGLPSEAEICVKGENVTCNIWNWHLECFGQNLELSKIWIGLKSNPEMFELEWKQQPPNSFKGIGSLSLFASGNPTYNHSKALGDCHHWLFHRVHSLVPLLIILPSLLWGRIKVPLASAGKERGKECVCVLEEGYASSSSSIP